MLPRSICTSISVRPLGAQCKAVFLSSINRGGAATRGLGTGPSPTSKAQRLEQGVSKPDRNPKTELEPEPLVRGYSSQGANSRAPASNGETYGLRPMSISDPARLYPAARRKRRNIILHVGPTNSGKSYTALEALKKSRSGFYAGPLRMLAREVYDRFVAQGVSCNLVTGDERIENLGADGQPALLNCGTIEMVDINAKYDVAVLDEIQMIEDPERGWAWTRALLGLQAREIHLCGDANSVSLVKEIVRQTGDDCTVKTYERLSPLVLAPRITPKQMVSSLQPQTCIVLFSKKQIIEVRERIVKELKRPCAVIYGSLPPEVRAEQARLFNDPDSGVDLLVASDAIGMGLNLAIDTVIFTTLSKFDGLRERDLVVPEIKQIAGRAGRFRVAGHNEGHSNQRPDGAVTALSPRDRRRIQKALAIPSPDLRQATCLPPVSVIMSATDNKAQRFSDVLSLVFRSAEFGPAYARPRTGSVLVIARLLNDIPGLTFEDRLILTNAPVPDVPEVQSAFVDYCKVIGMGTSRNISQILGDRLQILGRSSTPTPQLEMLHKSLTLFLWLLYKYPCNLLDRTSTEELKELCEHMISTQLNHRRHVGAGENSRTLAELLQGRDPAHRRRSPRYGRIKRGETKRSHGVAFPL